MVLAYSSGVSRGLRCLVAEPDTTTDPLVDALALAREAGELFERHGERQKASLMADAAAEIGAELAQRGQRLN